MKLFGNKKNNDVNINDFFAPAIPAEKDKWLSDNQINFPPTSLFGVSSETVPDAWFNVEVAALMVSTRIPPKCSKCDEKDECSGCKKSPSNFIKIMTANADGDYLGWAMASNLELASKLACDGYFVSFDKSIDRTFTKSNEELKFKSQPLAPILVSTLDVKPYAKGVGMLHIGDAFATIDGSDFISGIKVEAGKYAVVAWIGYTSTGDIAPMGMTILGKAFLDNLDFKIANISKVPKNISDSIYGSASGSVLARMGANLGALAEENANYYSAEDPITAYISESWAIQYSVHNDRKEFDAFLDESFEAGEIGQLLAVVDSLRIRGQQKLAMDILKKIEVKFKNELDDSHKMFIRVFKKLPAGAFGVPENLIL